MGNAGVQNFLLSNWQQNADADMDMEGVMRSGKSQGSFGTGSFTTNTFNARLAGSHGMAILKYVGDEDFGKHGESIKLVSNIQVSRYFHPAHNIFHVIGIHEQACLRKRKTGG